MTARHRRKLERYRGNTSHGWGSRKKHRGSGNRGGVGLAGTGKRSDHKKQWALKVFGKGYLGKTGFRIPQKLKREIRAINIKDLPDYDEINLTELGYDKLLSAGMPIRKHKIIVKNWSPKAKEKIEKAGGTLVAG